MTKHDPPPTLTAWNPDHYLNGLTDRDRTVMEQQAFNFFTHAGRKLRVPPSYFEILKAQGVSTIHIEPDAGLEWVDPKAGSTRP